MFEGLVLFGLLISFIVFCSHLLKFLSQGSAHNILLEKLLIKQDDVVIQLANLTLELRRAQKNIADILGKKITVELETEQATATPDMQEETTAETDYIAPTDIVEPETQAQDNFIETLLDNDNVTDQSHSYAAKSFSEAKVVDEAEVPFVLAVNEHIEEEKALEENYGESFTQSTLSESEVSSDIIDVQTVEPSLDSAITTEAAQFEESTTQFEESATQNEEISAQNVEEDYNYTHTPKRKTEPAKPSIIDNGVLLFKQLIASGNQWVLLGVLMLFVGFGFLAKYTIELGLFTPDLRLLSAAIFGLGLLVLGWKLRIKRREFALILQGGSIGILYITVIAAVRLYALIPPLMALVLLVLFAVFGALLAILQNAPILAHIALSGGFLAPILTSTNSGNYVGLFSFYILLNVSVFFITYFRNWKHLHLNAFLFSTIIPFLWGKDNYLPEMYTSVLPFILFYFLFFSLLTVIKGRKAGYEKIIHPNTLILFGSPIISFLFFAFVDPSYHVGTEPNLVLGVPFLALQTLLMGIVYVFIALRLWTKKGSHEKAHCESFLIFGLLFVNIAPLVALMKLDLANVNQLIWAASIISIEGFALLWSGLRQERLSLRVFGHLALVLSCLLVFIKVLGYNAIPNIAFLNINYLGLVVFFMALFASSYFIDKYKTELRKFELTLSGFYFICLSVLALLTSYLEGAWNYLGILFDRDLIIGSISFLALGVLSVLAVWIVYKKTWRRGLYLQLLPYVLAVFYLGIAFLSGRVSGKPSIDSNSVANILNDVPTYVFSLVLLSFPAFEYFLARLRFQFNQQIVQAMGDELSGFSKLEKRLSQLRLLLFFIVLVPFYKALIIFLGKDVEFLINHNLLALLTVLPTSCLLILLGLMYKKPKIQDYGFYLNLKYWLIASCFVLYSAVFGLWHRAFTSGPVIDGWYIPLLNPFELSIFALLCSMSFWLSAFVWTYFGVREEDKQASSLVNKGAALALLGKKYFAPYLFLGIGLFIFIHFSLARALYHFSAGSIAWSGIFYSLEYQSLLSVFWGISGLLGMILGNRFKIRWVWKMSAGLLLLDAVKLLLVDRTKTEGIWAIISFILVGIIFIAATYFSPLPPKAIEHKDDDKKETDEADETKADTDENKAETDDHTADADIDDKKETAELESEQKKERIETPE